MNRSTKKIAFLDRFYKKLCCGAKNHLISGLMRIQIARENFSWADRCKNATEQEGKA